MTDALPIDEVLPDLMSALHQHGKAVLQAPPGAGKTTRVPLAMLKAGFISGRIVVLEPRRLATRAAAERMADTLGEPVGETVGYRMRGDTKVGRQTRIEVVTEGILTRMIQSDPTLEGVGAIIFDEFHERSLNADLGLALALDISADLREDLVLLAMSATLDAEPVAALMGNAPVVTSEGQSFPVETRWLERPVSKSVRLEEAALTLLAKAASETSGGILVFLPGEGEIRRVLAAASGKLDGVDILPLYGSLPFKEQRRALAPSGNRKIVLATSIAETSLTIPDIRVVVDAGRARRARYDPGSGMSRLVTERVTRAEADQRKGRAGRVAEGVCYRLWTKGEEGGLSPFPPAEIETADLTGLALELAEWGSDELQFLNKPPEGALAEARAVLEAIEALSGGSITDHGRKLARLPLHPRLAHMLEKAGKGAALLAALLSERDPMRGAGCDLGQRVQALKSNRREPALDRIRAEAKRLEDRSPNTVYSDPAEQAALAFPDRIALRRPGDQPRWLLSGGKGVTMDAGDALAGQRLLVVTDTDGHPREATIRTCLAISESTLRDVLGDLVRTVKVVEWSKREGRVIQRIEEKLGEIVLSSKVWREAPEEQIAAAMLEGVRQLGFKWSDATVRFRARVNLLRDAGFELPSVDDADLMQTIEDWLLPYLSGVKTAGDWAGFDLLGALRARLDWDQMQALDREAPAHFETPLGRKIPIDYNGEAPEITLRIQEMFGVTQHPVVAGRALRVTMLSPGQKPVQTTMDIPGFWATSYADVRKDMRGRYPKHPWPEDPTVADPTLRAKPRGNR